MTDLSPNLSPIAAYEVNLQFTSDEQIAALNAHYRGQARPTDVLSFAACDDLPLPIEVLMQIPFNLGDIVVSLETAEKHCADHGHTLPEELLWLTAHGLLHLLGWDHPTEDDLQEMLSLQRKLLSKIGLTLTNSTYFLNSQ